MFKNKCNILICVNYYVIKKNIHFSFASSLNTTDLLFSSAWSIPIFLPEHLVLLSDDTQATCCTYRGRAVLAVAVLTPRSGLKCWQWQADMPLNRITLKMSCHQFLASHYPADWCTSGTTEWLAKAFQVLTRIKPLLMPDKRYKRQGADESFYLSCGGKCSEMKSW